MRTARIKADGAGYYHCMSRIIERRMILGDVEKERLLDLMRNLAAFGGLEILTYAFMSNHFHILIHVPERQDIPDEELLRRLRFIYSSPAVAMIREQLHAYRQEGNESAAATLRNRYTYRMYDISEYFKAIKQRFSHYYNAREDRTGPLWDQRFKSVLVEKSEDALLTMAAYIDLNPVRAGLVRDPKEYRFCGYGAALGGNHPARQGLRRLIHAVTGGDQFTWTAAQTVYRQRLYIQGRQKGVDPEGRPIRQGFSPEAVAAVVESGGILPLHEVLRCRVRYFSDGLALGSREFVDGVFARYRCHFGAKRQNGARAMRFGEWQKLCTLRDLRLSPIVRYNNG